MSEPFSIRACADAPRVTFLRPFKQSPLALDKKAYSKYPMDPQCLQTRCTKEMLPLPKTSLQMMDADLNLITTPKLFLEEEQLPENYRIVGPIFC